MTKEDIAYCGLDCELCKSKFADIRKIINNLDEAFSFEIEKTGCIQHQQVTVD